MSNILEFIRSKYPTLTKKQKEIADYMLANSENMCFVTLKTLSQDINVSEMTILSLCTTLGYANYNAVKYEFRKYAATTAKEQVNRSDSYVLPYIPKGDLQNDGDLLCHMAQDEIEGINRFFRGFSVDTYYQAARMICRARRVIMLGRGVSIQVANYMLTRLTMSGVACMTVDTENGDAVQAALHFIDADSLVIPISFPDYYFMTTRLAQFASTRGAALLGITDSTRADVAALCDMCLYCPTSGTRVFLNTLTTPILAANFLTLAVSIEKNRANGDKNSLAAEFSKFFDNGN